MEERGPPYQMSKGEFLAKIIRDRESTKKNRKFEVVAIQCIEKMRIQDGLVWNCIESLAK